MTPALLEPALLENFGFGSRFQQNIFHYLHRCITSFQHFFCDNVFVFRLSIQTVHKPMSRRLFAGADLETPKLATTAAGFHFSIGICGKASMIGEADKV